MSVWKNVSRKRSKTVLVLLGCLLFVGVLGAQTHLPEVTTTRASLGPDGKPTVKITASA